MSGFLDRDTRVVDMVLTGRGKYLLSKGSLKFCYWIPYDDEVDYQPFIALSGTMDGQTLSSSAYSLIESSLVREATTGYRSLNASARDNINVNNPMFTVPQGQRVLPHAIFPNELSMSLDTKQRKVQRVYAGDVAGTNLLDNVDLGIERFDSSNFVVELSYDDDGMPNDSEPEGFFMKMFRSGSDGLTEVIPQRDMSNDLSYGNTIKVQTGRKGG